MKGAEPLQPPTLAHYLAREGGAGLAERALCLRIVARESRPDVGIRARAFWRDGRIA